MSDLTIALAGGAIGSVLTAGSGQVALARAAWSDVELHDSEVRERNAQLVAWVDDRTKQLEADMKQRTGEFNAAGMFYSGGHGVGLAKLKADALHAYRDEQWRARIDLARLRALEGVWHRLWRIARRRPAPALFARDEVEPFLDRWREPVSRHGSGPSDATVPLDRTRRTTEEALAELPTMDLT